LLFIKKIRVYEDAQALLQSTLSGIPFLHLYSSRPRIHQLMDFVNFEERIGIIENAENEGTEDPIAFKSKENENQT
jgi:hypothetical protein